MPLIKSAKKRVRIAHKATVRNSKTKRSLKSALKSFLKTPTSQTHRVAQSNIDKAVKKGLVHKNKAARQKRRLAAHAKSVGVKHTAAKKSPAKAPTKKPATKKAASGKKK